MNRKHHILLLNLGVLGLGLLLAFLAAKGFRIPCLFYEVTGLQCPGCGNTRATIALLRLDFVAMLRWNLTYPLQMLYLLRVWVTCCSRYIRGFHFSYTPRPDWIDVAFILLLILWTILRNLI